MRFASGLLLLLGFAGPALACDCVRLDPKGPRFAEDLERIAQYYPVAAEGVVRSDGPYRWRFLPTREYRGPGKPTYSIDLISDCSLAPQEIGQIIGKPVFLLLAAGEGDYQGRYEASRCVNLLGTEIEAALRARFTGNCTPH